MEGEVGVARSGATREGSLEEEAGLAPNKQEDGMVGIGGAGLNLFLDGQIPEVKDLQWSKNAWLIQNGSNWDRVGEAGGLLVWPDYCHTEGSSLMKLGVWGGTMNRRKGQPLPTLKGQRLLQGVNFPRAGCARHQLGGNRFMS